MVEQSIDLKDREADCISESDEHQILLPQQPGGSQRAIFAVVNKDEKQHAQPRTPEGEQPILSHDGRDVTSWKAHDDFKVWIFVIIELTEIIFWSNRFEDSEDGVESEM